MKKTAKIIKDLGFNEKASNSVKEAFIKHLLKASTESKVLSLSEKAAVENDPKLDKIIHRQLPEQLAFGFMAEEARPLSKKKAVS
ncbi:MAG: hypothetical protein ACXVCP_01195 [Bdellovibrio sp.]